MLSIPIKRINVYACYETELSAYMQTYNHQKHKIIFKSYRTLCMLRSLFQL